MGGDTREGKEIVMNEGTAPPEIEILIEGVTETGTAEAVIEIEIEIEIIIEGVTETGTAEEVIGTETEGTTGMEVIVGVTETGMEEEGRSMEAVRAIAVVVTTAKEIGKIATSPPPPHSVYPD